MVGERLSRGFLAGWVLDPSGAKTGVRERAASAAVAQDDPVAQLNAGQTLADDFLADGRLDEAFAVLNGLVELTTSRLPERLSDVEATVLVPLLSRRPGVGAECRRACHATYSPIPDMSSRLFAYVAQNLAHALIELGRWGEAEVWLTQARAGYPRGWTAIEIQAESARLACYRGDFLPPEELAGTLSALCTAR